MKFPKTEIAQVLLSFKGAFRTVGIFSAIINLLMLVPSLYMLQVYDRVLASRNETTLLMLTLMALGAFLFMGALELVRSFVLIRIGAQLDMKMNKRIYTAAFEQNLKRAGGSAGQALQDFTAIRQFLTGQGLFAFFDVPWFPIYLAVIFLFSPLLGLFALAGAAVLIALAFANQALSKKPLEEANAVAITSGNLATNNLRNAEVIAAMGMLPDLMARWLRLNDRVLRLQAEASQKAGKINSITKFVRVSMQSLILGLGALLVLEGKITPGMMIVTVILLGRTLSPVEQLIGAWKSWSS
ncbi:MAG TPA: ABC transporter transmembrane domain-containing protein, partial [Ktedonobacteraceae bacterium]|nr:ABC transporter transmembrane domain-containing protein [Ktedonobacteraceae bacterium]